MIFDIVFHPTNSFESAFNSEFDFKSVLTVIILSGLLLSASVFLLTSSLVFSIISFIINIVNWIVLSGLLFFFEFVHNKKRIKSSSKVFNRSLFVLSKLWKINLIFYSLIFGGCLLLPIINGILFNVIAGIFFVALIILVISWIIASFKMLKIVLKINKLKLLINWILFMFLNSLISFLLSNLLSIFLI
ncbi:MAG: hypothetical protein PHY04_01680 [Candidatus ainarchaeum sp.]|nr:hypothetical protein [Candidatus ainarchaeum sp.]MDD4128427.1 hypothetical protein [Candidatus ainarchaeum sp.]MDD4467672.1 hypothetical protein [Candidatus ainarchaeum sp.]